MTIIDISMPMELDMPVYKNREAKRPKIKVTQDFKSGSVFESRMDIDLHTGTHMDAPLHMIEDGEDITVYPINQFISPCRVLDLSHVKDHITREHLIEKQVLPGEFVLLKTRNSFDDEFNPEFVFLEKSGAEYLAGKDIEGVGIDSLGIERSQPGHETHKALLSKRIKILEGLRLETVEEGPYVLVATPHNIPGAEASPVRALLADRKYFNL
ncbi:MAG: cyclase family protein [Clostridiales bacterium]|nr:cyclase family protein [Clostridiales bacterium]